MTEKNNGGIEIIKAKQLGNKSHRLENTQPELSEISKFTKDFNTVGALVFLKDMQALKGGPNKIIMTVQEVEKRFCFEPLRKMTLPQRQERVLEVLEAFNSFKMNYTTPEGVERVKVLPPFIIDYAKKGDKPIEIEVNPLFIDILNHSKKGKQF